MSVYSCKRIFRYRLSPEIFGYTLVWHLQWHCRAAGSLCSIEFHAESMRHTNIRAPVVCTEQQWWVMIDFGYHSPTSRPHDQRLASWPCGHRSHGAQLGTSPTHMEFVIWMAKSWTLFHDTLPAHSTLVSILHSFVCIKSFRVIWSPSAQENNPIIWLLTCTYKTVNKTMYLEAGLETSSVYRCLSCCFILSAKTIYVN